MHYKLLNVQSGVLGFWGDCKYGNIIQWDGSNLTHGNKINKTGKARVSIDFRVIKYSNYKPSEHGSINTKTKFQIGGYYKIL